MPGVMLKMAQDTQNVPPVYTHARKPRLTKKQIGSWIRSSLIHVSLIPAAFVFLLPFLWMLSTSLKPDTQFYDYPPVWIPSPFQWSNYPDAVTYITFGLYLRNTFTIAILSTIGVIISSSLVAYSLARIPWRGRNVLFILTVATLMLPFQVTMIPLFIIFKNLGWINSWLPLIVPHWFGGALYIFLLRQFFMTIPMELSEASRIDGASEVSDLSFGDSSTSQARLGDGCHLRIYCPLARLHWSAHLSEQSKTLHALARYL